MCVCNGRSFDLESNTSLEATGRVPLKVQLIALATGRNRSVLSMLDQIEIMYIVVAGIW